MPADRLGLGTVPVCLPADSRCPRCGHAFACGARGPAPCACAAVPLDAALQAQLRQRYVGCLCLACLQALASGHELDPA